MVHRKQILDLLFKVILNCVAQLFHRIRFTRRDAAGECPKKEDATSKTSITISGEYRKEEKKRNGNSRRT